MIKVDKLIYEKLLKTYTDAKNKTQSEQAQNTYISMLATLALDIRRIQKKITKINTDKDKLEWFDFIFEKIKTLLLSYTIKVIDPTWYKYNEGMTYIDVISMEKWDVTEDIIIETIEPAIEINGTLTRKAKVIVLQHY